MESTNQNPLAYFESLIVNNDLNTYLQKYLDDFVEHSDYKIFDVDKIKGIVKYHDYDIDGKYIVEKEDRFEDAIQVELFNQYNISKELINESVAEISKSGEDYTGFLLLQEKQIQYIINNGEKQINLFPILLKPLNSIVNYINKKYLSENKIKIGVNTSFLILEEPKKEYNSDVQIIISVLGYLKNNNDKRQKIMSDEQFNLMIEYVNFYVENNTFPQNIKKLDSLNISNNLLRFTFWVLHKKLYTTNSIRQEFIQLIKQIFSDFDNWEESTLKRKFGNRDKVQHNGRHFIPEIIKSELNRV
ncbi:hypothetical protein [Flavobacterium sp.]|uniref:hypothetical protein n=1 Tax=Flavobacterium sp. TaxID=239 RepID=UPI0035AEE530